MWLILDFGEHYVLLITLKPQRLSFSSPPRPLASPTFPSLRNGRGFIFYGHNKFSVTSGDCGGVGCVGVKIVIRQWQRHIRTAGKTHLICGNGYLYPHHESTPASPDSLSFRLK